jgi:hypothetical protein
MPIDEARFTAFSCGFPGMYGVIFRSKRDFLLVKSTQSDF